MRKNFLEQVRIGWERLEYVLSGFHQGKIQKGEFFVKSRMSKPVHARFELLLMSKNLLEQFRIGFERLEYVLSCFYCRNMRETGLFHQISYENSGSCGIWTTLNEEEFSRTFSNRLGTVWIRFILFLLPKCTRNGTFFIKSRRRKPVLAGFQLLSISRKFLGQDWIDWERFEYVLSCFYYRNVRKSGHFSSNLVEENQFSRDLNYFEWGGSFLNKLESVGNGLNTVINLEYAFLLVPLFLSKLWYVLCDYLVFGDLEIFRARNN